MPSKTKSKSKGVRKLKKSAPKPKYSDMILAAITAMQEQDGASTQKILKFIGANYKVGKGFEVHARLALKKLLQAGTLVCTKGSCTYKLAPTKKATRTTRRRRRSAGKRFGAAKKAGKRRKSGKRKAASKKRRASPKRKGSAGRKRSATRKPKTSAKKPRTTLRRRLPRRYTTKK